jgi:hypothetical protein
VVQSVQRLATPGRSGDRVRVGARFFSPVQTHTLSAESYPGVKRQGRGLNCPLLFIAEVKEGVGLYL